MDQELPTRLGSDRGKICEGAFNSVDEMQKEMSDSCEKVLSDTVTTYMC